MCVCERERHWGEHGREREREGGGLTGRERERWTERGERDKTGREGEKTTDRQLIYIYIYNYIHI